MAARVHLRLFFIVAAAAFASGLAAGAFAVRYTLPNITVTPQRLHEWISTPDSAKKDASLVQGFRRLAHSGDAVVTKRLLTDTAKAFQHKGLIDEFHNLLISLRLPDKPTELDLPLYSNLISEFCQIRRFDDARELTKALAPLRAQTRLVPAIEEENMKIDQFEAREQISETLSLKDAPPPPSGPIKNDDIIHQIDASIAVLAAIPETTRRYIDAITGESNFALAQRLARFAVGTKGALDHVGFEILYAAVGPFAKEVASWVEELALTLRNQPERGEEWRRFVEKIPDRSWPLSCLKSGSAETIGGWNEAVGKAQTCAEAFPRFFKR